MIIPWICVRVRHCLRIAVLVRGIYATISGLPGWAPATHFKGHHLIGRNAMGGSGGDIFSRRNGERRRGKSTKHCAMLCARNGSTVVEVRRLTGREAARLRTRHGKHPRLQRARRKERPNLLDPKPPDRFLAPPWLLLLLSSAENLLPKPPCDCELPCPVGCSFLQLSIIELAF